MINDIKSNKYKINEKINLYKENLIKFIIGQKDKIIQIGAIEEIDYIVGIFFLTETNRYFKQNKISIHSYYLSYAFINIFNKIRKKMLKSYCFDINDTNHFMMSLFNNIDYLNSRVDTVNTIKNKINNNISKFMIGILPILTNLLKYKKIHELDYNKNYENKIETLSSSSSIDVEANINLNSKLNNKLNTKLNTGLENMDNQIGLNELHLNPIESPNKKIKSQKKISRYDDDKYCNKECSQCWISNILGKFFYILLQTAKFLGCGTYNDPSLHRLAEYYANIFYTWFKSNDIIFVNSSDISCTEFYENYLDYKNKLNYSLIELDLGSETLDEIIKFLDNNIIENLSIKIK